MFNHRLRVVSNFGDGDCGVGKIHARARNFEEKRREVSAELAPQSPSPKLETTRSLVQPKQSLFPLSLSRMKVKPL